MTVQTFTIDVYRDDPIWNMCPAIRWFQLPLGDLDRLFVARHEVSGEGACESDVRRHAQELRAFHPDCVMVHI